MVSRDEKLRQTEFLANRIEESGKYNILERDHYHVLLLDKLNSAKNPTKIYIAAHNDSRETKKDLITVQNENKRHGVYTTHFFYKNGKTYMVGLGGTAYHQSIQGLSDKDRHSMIHARDLEKIIERNYDSEVVYYQPETTKLPESIRIFRMKRVPLDYSYLSRNDPKSRFAKSGYSLDYKLPKEIASSISGPIDLELDRVFKAFLRVMKRDISQPKTKIFQPTLF